jgi:hypothetical protein
MLDFNSLPDELKLAMLSFVDPLTLISSVRFVSKDMHRLSQDEDLWRNHYQTLFVTAPAKDAGVSSMQKEIIQGLTSGLFNNLMLAPSQSQHHQAVMVSILGTYGLALKKFMTPLHKAQFDPKWAEMHNMDFIERNHVKLQFMLNTPSDDLGYCSCYKPGSRQSSRPAGVVICPGDEAMLNKYKRFLDDTTRACHAFIALMPGAELSASKIQGNYPNCTILDFQQVSKACVSMDEVSENTRKLYEKMFAEMISRISNVAAATVASPSPSASPSPGCTLL